MKIALVHDYLRDYGGAERVVEALHEIFPDAPVYVAFKDEKALGIQAGKFHSWEIHQSWLTKIPFYRKLFSPLRLFAPQYFRSFDLSGYDLVISSNNAYFSKAVRVPNGVHICYCHTPPRSLYGYTTMTDWQKNPLIRLGGTLINHYLRVVDVRVTQEVDYFIANSQTTRARIKKFYRRDAEVIYPPVDVPDQLPKETEKNYYLYVGRIAKSKHVDLAIQACTLLGLSLKVAGTGCGLDYLRSLAGPTVELLGEVPDSQLRDLYKDAKALIFPAEDEDFGMVPVEAMGYGVPVIAHRSGGPLESIQEGKTGVFFDEFTVDSLVQAIEKFQNSKFDRQAIHQHARKFSKEEFQKKIKEFIKKYGNI